MDNSARPAQDGKQITSLTAEGAIKHGQMDATVVDEKELEDVFKKKRSKGAKKRKFSIPDGATRLTPPPSLKIKGPIRRLDKKFKTSNNESRGLDVKTLIFSTLAFLLALVVLGIIYLAVVI